MDRTAQDYNEVNCERLRCTVPVGRLRQWLRGLIELGRHKTPLAAIYKVQQQRLLRRLRLAHYRHDLR